MEKCGRKKKEERTMNCSDDYAQVPAELLGEIKWVTVAFYLATALFFGFLIFTSFAWCTSEMTILNIVCIFGIKASFVIAFCSWLIWTGLE